MRAAFAAGVVALLGIACPAPAQLDLHGFVSGAWGVRTASAPEADSDYTLQEVRAQLLGTAAGNAGAAVLRLDFVHDALEDPEEHVEIREVQLRFTTLRDHLDVKAGRQILTWGTGDLVFVNDNFPRDWESFFAGRAIQYLRVPSDAIRLGLYGLPFDVDVVVTPDFTPDRLPEPGGRFSVSRPDSVGAPAEPADTIENGEIAARLSRYVADFTVELYGYWGFTKVPAGFLPPMDGTVHPFYPRLHVYGASGRGGLGGGVAWLEGGYYDSRDAEANPTVVPSSVKVLGGYERRLFPQFTATAQYLGEFFRDEGTRREGDLHLVTLRLEQLLRYDSVRLSLFTYWYPEIGDAYLRFFVGHDVNDDTEVVLGTNVFFRGTGDPSQFAPFDRDDNVYLRLRYSF